MNFKIGDVVIVKSGSPPMTIHNIGDYGPLGPSPGVLCIWFNAGVKNEEVFHPDVLTPYATEA